MGGKTATAQKIPRKDKKWLVSVMSFAPVDNPKILLYVLIDEPDGTTGGSGDGMDSQTLTKAIMTELLPYMTISRTDDKEVVMPVREEENPDGGVETPDNAEEYDYDKEDEDEIEDYNSQDETTSEIEDSEETQDEEENTDEDNEYNGDDEDKEE